MPDNIENQNTNEQIENKDKINDTSINELKSVETDQNIGQEITSGLNDANISIPENKYESEFTQPENNEFLESTEYSTEQFEQDKNIVFDVIRRNGGFKTNPEYSNNTTGTKEKGDQFLKENYMMLANPDQIKTRVIIQNNIITKNNFIKKEEKNTININKFMETFTKEQEKIRTKYEKIIITNEPIMIKGDNQIQEVGKFIEISENNKNSIKTQLDRAIKQGQDITSITITGKADSTGPKIDKMEFPGDQVKESLRKLESKGFDKELINNVELANGEVISIQDFINNKDDKNKVNQTWAYARALMQFDFLNEEQLGLIKNSQSFKIKIDAQTVGDETKKGDEYTGGEVEFKTKGNERTETKEVTLPLKELNSPTLLFHININDTKNGTINLIYKENKLELVKSRDKPSDSYGLDYLDIARNSNIAQNSPANYDYGNLTLNLHLSNEDIGFLNPKEITEEMPGGTKTQNKAENIKSYIDKSNNFFDNLNNQPEDFIKLLNMYKEKTNKLEEKKYIEGVINTIKLLNS